MPEILKLFGESAVDFFNLEDNKVEIPLPGVKKESICVEMTPNEKITIKYRDRKDEERTLKMGATGYVDASASYSEGLLSIQLKQRELETKNIKID
jgi:HSP20 family molecular chaperone IbpA